MNRRQFYKKITLPFLAAPFFSPTKASAEAEKRKFKKKKPARLIPGDTIGLITPGSYIGDEGLENAVKHVEELGFKVRLSKNIRAKRGFIAGTDAQRLSDLHTMFEDKEVAGIWCARGGYGCTRLLPYLDYKLIKKNPKAFIGYSDITALHQAIHLKTGLITFHGPVGASELTPYTRKNFEAVLMDGKVPYTIELSEENKLEENEVFHAKTLKAGRVTGTLAGGNLSLLASMAGTAYELDARDKILFIEDIGEKPYRIDRMLTQLRQSAHLDQAAGIALGIFEDCQPKPDEDSLSLMETLEDRLSGLGKPLVYGFSFGHIKNQCTFPVGIEAELDTGKQRITLLDTAVE